MYNVYDKLLYRPGHSMHLYAPFRYISLSKMYCKLTKMFFLCFTTNRISKIGKNRRHIDVSRQGLYGCTMYCTFTQCQCLQKVCMYRLSTSIDKLRIKTQNNINRDMQFYRVAATNNGFAVAVRGKIKTLLWGAIS